MEIYHLQKIKMSGNEHGQLRANTIYAELIRDDGTQVVSATLEYILSVIRDRNLAVNGVTIQSNVQRGVKCSEVFLDSYQSAQSVEPNKPCDHQILKGEDSGWRCCACGERLCMR